MAQVMQANCASTDPAIGLLTSWEGIAYCSYQKQEAHKMQAYCVKCRAKREMKDARAITMKNGKPATQGVCPVCGTKMFRIGKG
ncbi:hypothetical protein ES703_11915 [subsurface metagenome]